MIRLFCVGVGFPHLSSHQRFYCITLYMFRHQKGEHEIRICNFGIQGTR